MEEKKKQVFDIFGIVSSLLFTLNFFFEGGSMTIKGFN